MSRFRCEDILVIGEAAGDRTALYARLGEMLDSSTDIRADVESLSMETGEYRVVLRGTLVNRPLADTDRPRPGDGGPSVDVAVPGAVAMAGGLVPEV